MRGEFLLLLLSLSVVNSEVNEAFIRQYQNYTIPDLRSVCLGFEISSSVSEKCAEQLEVTCGDTTLFAKMLDASSKFPWTGLAYGARWDFGNFDECMTIDYEYTGGRILGMHCTIGLLIPDVFGNISDENAYYRLSVCKPDACSAADFNTIINGFDIPSLFIDRMCQTVETNTEITASDIVTIIIFLAVILLMIVSTIYDFYLYKSQSESRHPLFLAFSVISNGKKLLHISKNSKEQIQTFHGLKTISMMWIVAGHGFSMFQNQNIMNLNDTVEWLRRRASAYITAAPLAVDTFFFISGYLLAFQYLKQKPKPLKTQVLSVPRMYLHRYLRLTPAMLMVFLVTISIFKHLGAGPLYSYGADAFSGTCRDHWWEFFLYVQNYVLKIDDFCLVQTWYLSADMQMFLLSPLVLIPISLNLKRSSGFMWSMIELLILNLFFIFLPMALKLLVPDYTNEYDTHSRLTNYFIGFMLAVFMRVTIEKPFLYMIRKERVAIINLVTWIVVLLGMLAVVICYQEVEVYHGHDSRSVFQSLMRPAWCIGLSWIVYSSYHGYGGIVNEILTAPIMHIMGRLTYCIYLTHITVEGYYAVTNREKIYFSDYHVFYIFCGTFTLTTVVSIFWTLAFESPLLIVEKHLLGTGKRRSNLNSNGHR